MWQDRGRPDDLLWTGKSYRELSLWRESYTGGLSETEEDFADPDGKWIASGSQDGTIRLWPMPEGTPFHTLPYEEILQRLRGLTNLRVVPDETSDTGYRIEVGPFPGWKTLPTW